MIKLFTVRNRKIAAEETDVFFNKEKTMACKCWLDIPSQCNEGLRYEAQVYELLTKLGINGVNKSLYNGRTPLKEASKIIQTTLGTSADHLRYTITESSPNYIRLDLFDDTDITNKDADAIVLQILYTLQELKKHNIKHNDLHNGNIFIHVLQSPITLDYINVRTKYVTKIFDWNKATAAQLGTNSNADPEDLIDGSDRHTFLRINTDLYTINPKLLKIREACIRAVPSYADGVGSDSDSE